MNITLNWYFLNS